MSDARPRRLTIADIGRKPLIDLTEPPRPAPRPLKPPATAKPPPKVAKPPAPVQAAPAKAKPRAPGEKTEAQRAKRRRYQAKHNAKIRAELRPQAEALLTELQARYPAAFAKGWPKPLALGVHHTILADLGCDPEVLGIALRIWCGQPAYLANTVDMSHRHGLDGAPTTELTAEEHTNAKARLDGLQAMFKQRAKQRRDVPR